MNAPWVSAFTVVTMDDWALLFIGEQLAEQAHTIRLYDIAKLAGDTPITLAVVDAHGTLLEAVITATGGWKPETPLHKALELIKLEPAEDKPKKGKK